jgi:hypothetical protein
MVEQIKNSDPVLIENLLAEELPEENAQQERQQVQHAEQERGMSQLDCSNFILFLCFVDLVFGFILTRIDSDQRMNVEPARICCIPFCQATFETHRICAIHGCNHKICEDCFGQLAEPKRCPLCQQEIVTYELLVHRDV